MKDRHPSDFQSVPFRSLDLLPSFAGIYFAMQDDEVLYVGQSKNIRKRWMFHHKYNELLEFESVRIHWIRSDGRPLLQQENEWIQLCNPPLNYRKIVYLQKEAPIVEVSTKTPLSIDILFIATITIANITIFMETAKIGLPQEIYTAGWIVFLMGACCMFSSLLTTVNINRKYDSGNGGRAK